MGVLSAWVPPARACWIAGAAFLWIHSLLAFHEVYHWSHAAAVEGTARQVELVTGYRSGSGLWVNYAFLLGWAWVAWNWDRLGVQARRLWWACLLFMGFNGAVVFVTGTARWLGTLWILAALGSAVRDGRRPSLSPAARTSATGPEP